MSELDWQIQTLVDRGYPEALDLAVDEFRHMLEPLRGRVPQRSGTHGGVVPIVLVVGAGLPAADTITRTDLVGGAGFTTMDADDLARFVPIPEVSVPTGLGYLLLDVDPGGDLLDVPPDQALPVIRERGRSPLTVAEGIALATHRPDLLADGSRYSLLASRCGDSRVPAIWVSQRRPRLGWCWDGAPHTWLGSASCAGRRAG